MSFFNKFLTLLTFCFFLSTSVIAQMDNEFWFAAPTLTTDCVSGGCTGGEPIYLRIGTIDWDAKVLVTIPITGDTIAYIDVLGGGGATIDLTAWRANIETGQGIDNTGILVQSWNETTNSVSGILITAFYEIGMASRDADNFVLKGGNAIGTSFMVPTQNTHDNMTTIAPLPVHGVYIVATEAADIDITLPPTASANGFPAGASIPTFHLDAGETYGLIATSNLGVNHLAGTTIESTGNIAVTMSDDAVDYGTKEDLNGDQIIPLNLIGSDYVVIGGPGANGSEVFITVVNDGTSIDYVDDFGVTQTVGPFAAKTVFSYSLSTGNNSFVNATNNILVYQLTSFQDFGGAILPPINGCTGSQDVSIFRPTTQRFHMYIMVPTGATDAFLVDGVAIPELQPSEFTDLGNGWSVITDATWSHSAIDDGVVSKIVNTEEVFHLGVVSTIAANGTSYGYFSDYGVSNASAMEVGDASQFASVCFGDSIQLTATGGSIFSWYNKATGNPDYLNDPNIQSPVLTNIPVGQYIYEVAISGACVSDTLEIWIQIKEGIDAFFQVDDAIGCAPHYVKIDNYTSGGDDFRWDFEGDGFDVITNDSAAVTNHTYYNTSSTDTAYYLKLFAKNPSGCSDNFTRYIQVFPEITAGFNQNFDIGCNPLSVQFTDTSSGNLNQNYWEFGDGDVAVDSIDPFHIYENVNTTDTIYTVTLINTSPYNCKDTATKSITVNPFIEARFSIDKNVGCAPLEVNVTNLSRGGITSYSWDYGDGFTSTDQNPTPNPHIYTNLTNLPIDDTLRLVVANANGCTDTLERIIRVYPIIKADYAVDVDEGCNTLDVVFTNNSTGATTVDWNFGDGISSNSTAATINHSYNNYFTHDTIFGFSLHVESDYGCSDDTTGNITVYRTFADFKIDTAQGCSPLNVNIINTSIGDINIYEWFYDDGSPVDNNINPVSHPYTNITGAPVTHNLKLRVSGNGGCKDSLTLPIDVYSEVTAAFTPTNIVGCDSTVINFVNNSSAWTTIYDWSFGDGTSSNMTTPEHIYRNFTSSDVDYKTLLKVTTVNGCTDTISTNVRIHPYVKADFAIDPSEGCSPFILDVEAVSYPGIGIYNWDFDNGNTPSGINPVAETYLNSSGITDNYLIELSVIDVTGNCHDTLTIPINVFSEAKADFTPMDDIDCNPFDITFDGTPAFNALLYNWDFGDGASSNSQNPFHSFVNTTDAIVPYTVSLEVTSADGCTHDTSTTVSVYPYVLADFDINIVNGCSPFEVQITNNSRGGNYRFFWDDDNLLVADSTFVVNNTFTKWYYNNSGTTQTFNLTLIADNGNNCYDTLQRTLTVYTEIDAQFSFAPVAGSGCNPLTVNFTNNTINGNSYNWYFGDGSSTTIESPDHTFNNNSTSNKIFDVKMVAESVNECIDSANTIITVYSKVDAGFSVETSEGCPPFNTTITNTSYGNIANTYEWQIDGIPVVGSPTDKSDFTHTYTNANHLASQYYQVKLITENAEACSSIHIDTITVYESVTAGYTMDIDNGCNPLEVQFTDAALVPASTTYIWNFGDGASSGTANPTHTFYNPSRIADLNYTIEQIVLSANYCSDTVTDQVSVYHLPLSKFWIDNTSSCPDLIANMNNFESKGFDSFEWRFGDGNTNTTNTSLTYTYPNTLVDVVQNYELEHWVTTANGCSDSTSLVLNVFPDVIANFTATPQNGCSPVTVSFDSDPSSNPAKFFYWDFGGDGTSNDIAPIHTFTNTWSTDRVYDIVMIARSEYDCRDTITKPVTSYAQPIAEFDVNPVVQRFPDNQVDIDNKTSPIAGPFDYLWEFDDTQTSTTKEPGSHLYDHWGEYNIKLTVNSQTSTCSDNVINTITILPPAINADFIADKTKGCLHGGFDVTFTAASSSYSEIYDYFWKFGDGNSATGQIVSHTYEKAGVYYVKMTATGLGGEDYEYETIRVYSNPVANFEVSPRSVMLNYDLVGRVEFFNLSECNDTTGCAYLWDFGDGTTGISRDLTHNYTEIGLYDIGLTVTSANGCVDSLLKPEEVEILGAGKIKFPNAFTPNNDGLNDTFRPVSEGVIKYELLIYTRWGELIFTTKDLSAGWDGILKGKPAKPDVYVWKAEGKFTNGRAFELAGDVTLIR